MARLKGKWDLTVLPVNHSPSLLNKLKGNTLTSVGLSGKLWKHQDLVLL